jgi:hypothetical protein
MLNHLLCVLSYNSANKIESDRFLANSIEKRKELKRQGLITVLVYLGRAAQRYTLGCLLPVSGTLHAAALIGDDILIEV